MTEAKFEDVLLRELSLVYGRRNRRTSTAGAIKRLFGLDPKDAAEKLGVSISGMKSRVQRGRRKLKNVLLNCCEVELDRRGGPVDYRRRNPDACDCCDEEP